MHASLRDNVSSQLSASYKTQISFLMIHIIRDQASTRQIQQMQQEFGDFIKVVVDIRRSILAGGGEAHFDLEQLLLQDGSLQRDLWGANWFPETGEIEFESIINIRPSQNNRSMWIEDSIIQIQVTQIIQQRLQR